MKVETPQILWHSDPNGKAAPLYSISSLESGLSKSEEEQYGTVVATAGNSSDVHLWKVSFGSQKISHLTSLSRHERSVNAVAFSPDGIHLATAGDGGTIIVWSVPPNKRGNGNGRHFWGTYLEEEKELDVKILPSSNCQDIMDISWSLDSQRFVCGSLDHCIMVWELTHQNWTCVHRDATGHSHYVQGVAMDPLGVYLASQGSDRAVCVYSNAVVNNHTKKGKHQHNNNNNKKDVLSKVKTIKRYHTTNTNRKHNLFADESTVESFFRRLSWTMDGAFLIAPSGLWYKQQQQQETNQNNNETPSFATLLFARHNYDQPYKVLTGHEKPSVVIRPNPVLFQYPPNVDGSKLPIPYRSIFAVLTLDTIYIYDTFHSRPLAVAKGLHYAGLTDCTWSADGHKLMVTSTDGYVSMLIFQAGELGEIYKDETKNAVQSMDTTEQECNTNNQEEVVKPTINDQHANPKSQECSTVTDLQPCKHHFEDNTIKVDDHPVDEPMKKKLKKRIQPLLVS